MRITYSILEAGRPFLLIVSMCAPAVVAAQTLVWVHQFPGASRGVAVDGDGNSVIANNTVDFPASKWESTVRKIDPFANVLWESLISESDDVFIHAVAADGNGRVAVAGRIGSGNEADAFVRIFDSAGNEEWSSIFGDSTANDEARGVAFDADGNVYVGGRTNGIITVSWGGLDGFLRKYDASGAEEWTKQLGTPANDAVLGVATDSAGNALITGTTSGDLHDSLIGSSDGFVRKYHPTGDELWTQQFGSAGKSTEGVSVASTAGDQVLVGGHVNALQEQFVTKFDASGSSLWTASLSPQPFERDVAVAGDGSGNAYLAGMTFLGDSLGPDIAGGEVDSDDAYVQKRLAADGALDWSVRLSSRAMDLPASFDKSLGVATFGMGNVYLTGETTGTFGGFGSGNGFIARLVADVTASDIGTDIQSAPGDAFRAEGHRSAMLSIVADVELAIAVGDIDEAVRKLSNLLRRVDGCQDEGAPDSNDWIIHCDVQDVVRALIEELMADLS